MENIRLLNEDEARKIAEDLWETKKMQDYLIDTYDFYRLKDGLIIELEKVKKISIDKTMYYDDEYEAPDVTEKNFISYNKSNVPGRNLEDYLQEKEKLQTQGCATGRYDYNGIYLNESYTNNKYMVYCDWHDRDNNYSRGIFKRYLTPEEEKEYIELIKERQEQYIERLKKYFERYGKHVTTYGYWANR